MSGQIPLLSPCGETRPFTPIVYKSRDNNLGNEFRRLSCGQYQHQAESKSQGYSLNYVASQSIYICTNTWSTSTLAQAVMYNYLLTLSMFRSVGELDEGYFRGPEVRIPQARMRLL